MRYVISLLAFTLSLCCLQVVAAAGDPGINVTKLVGLEKRQVRLLLGNPTECSPSLSSNAPRGTTCYYADKHQTEITFIHGKADWISMSNLPVPFNSDIPTHFALPANHPPDFASETSKRWTNIGPFKQLSAFPGPPGLSLINFRVTPLH